jgi:CRISPR-associated protein (TIGR02584 family)
MKILGGYKLAAYANRPAIRYVLDDENLSTAMPPPFEDPTTYPRRVLLAVTGLTPQIVTETLYALCVARRPAWVPTELRIITTRQGKEKAVRALLSGDPGWFRRLRQDYRLPEIVFGDENIRVITGSDGAPLDDIIEEADNAAVADFITEEVRAITAEPDTSLHVSIAGGRKTMGFYIGYALSLFGRAQDRLSHVLVTPPFESLKEFFYPAPGTRLIRDANSWELDAKDARVHLGEIPFVRLRDGLPERILQGRALFSGAVTEAQNALPPLALNLDTATRTVTAGGKCLILTPGQFAFYWMMVDRCVAGRGGAHWTDPGIAEELLASYGRVVNPASGVYHNTERAYLKKSGKGDFKYLFDPPKARVNGALKSALGERLASPYLIVKLEPIAGTPYHCFGLPLPPEAITIVATSLSARRARAARPNSKRSKAISAQTSQ